MLAAASGPFAAGCFASAGCAALEARPELVMGIETVGTGAHVQVEVEDMVSIEVETEVSQVTLDLPLKAWLAREFVKDDTGVTPGLTTMYVGIIAGDRVVVTF